MKKATAVEKRYFPWTNQKFCDVLGNSLQRLHWAQLQVNDSYVKAVCRQEVRLGDGICPLEFSLTATWKEIGEGIEVTISVSEEQNSWSIIECKKKCKVLLECLYAPVYSRAMPGEIAVAR